MEAGRLMGSPRLHPHLPYSNEATSQISDLREETSEAKPHQGHDVPAG